MIDKVAVRFHLFELLAGVGRSGSRVAISQTGWPGVTTHTTAARQPATRRRRRSAAGRVSIVTGTVRYAPAPWGGKTSCGPPILMMQTS